MNKERLRRHVALLPEEEPGSAADDASLVPAAVLIPLIERDDGLYILLTRRTETLRSHAGQISLPGGRIEPDDASVEAAALRESQEEIGLPPERVEVLGRLHRRRTRTGYLVYPVVGLIELPVRLRPDPGEVAEIFEVPLSFLLDPANHRPHVIEHGGQRYEQVALPYGDYYIWGATAAILQELYRALTNEVGHS